MDFFSPDSQPLYNDLILLPQKGAATGGSGRPPNSFALLFEGYSVLFDAPYSWTLSGIEDLASKSYPPRSSSSLTATSRGKATLTKGCKRTTVYLSSSIPTTPRTPKRSAQVLT